MEIKSETFDTTKYKLGKLCSRNHEYENTGKSLRYKNKKSPICLRCKSQAAKRNRLKKLKKKSGRLPLKPISPTVITRPRTPVANYRNPIQARAAVINQLQQEGATAEQIAKKLKESVRYIEAILYELVTEDYSLITFDRSTKIYKYLMFEPNKK